MTTQTITTQPQNGTASPPPITSEGILATCEETLFKAVSLLADRRDLTGIHAVVQAIAILQQERSAEPQEEY